MSMTEKISPHLPNEMASDVAIIASTRHWLEKAVIGLNLCPFAKSVHIKNQIRFVVSHASNEEMLMQELVQELEVLAEANPETIDTTLLIHPWVLQDFLDFNDFLELVDDIVEERDLAGILQVASFHPQFQFADTSPEDIENATNQSPYPILHLLREDSIDKAVEAFPEAETIYEKNIITMKALGWERWRAMMKSQE